MINLYLHIGLFCVHKLLNHHAQALGDGHVTGGGSGVSVLSGVRVPVDLRHEDGDLGERLIEVTHRLWVLQEERRQKFDLCSYIDHLYYLRCFFFSFRYPGLGRLLGDNWEHLFII